MEPLVPKRLVNILWAGVLLTILGFFFGSLSVWKDTQSEIAYPAEEFGRTVAYPEGFWLEGALLFVLVTASASLLSLAVRRLIVTVNGYDNPKGSLQLQFWGHLITGLGVACMFINPSLGTLVFITGLACLVISLQQKCPHRSHLLES